MRENGLKEIWAGGGTALNGWLHVPHSYPAEVMAHAGWDSLTIDMQHGPSDYAAALSMLQAISTTDTVPLVRVPWNEPGLIMRMLDAGCYGVICPTINTQRDAERFVGACRYPPDGYRSYGPFRAALYAGPDYPERANDAVVALPMIETRQALDNLDAILDVPGVDGAFVGPADLGQSLLGRAQLDPTEPEVVAAIDRVVAAARERDLVAGIFTGSVEYASEMISKGFDLVTVLSDARLMALEAARVVAAVRKNLP